MEAKLFFKKNSATILTVVGGVGVVTTSVIAVKATPKALRLIEESKKEKGEELTKLEMVLAAGPAYIPAVVTGVATIACIFGANMINKRQQASLMSAYALLDSSYKSYKDKTVELYGEDTDKEIRTEIAKDKYKEVDIPEAKDDGMRLFYDEYSQRFFRATNETVLSAEYNINKRVSDNSGASINELYEMLGLDPLPQGDDFGWSYGQLMEMYWSSWVDFYHQRDVNAEGEEFFIIEMTEPVPEFYDC